MTLSASHPPIDPRRAKHFLIEMIRRIPDRFKEWKSAAEVSGDDDQILSVADDKSDFGMALLKLAAHMGETLTGQINRVPEKNFLAFLDFLGIDRKPPQPARAPLTFVLSDKAPTDRLVPRGTQVGAAKREDVVFETELDLIVTRAILAGAFSVDLRKDRYIELSGLLAAPDAAGLEVFGDAGGPSAWQANPHALYIGHDSLYANADRAGAGLTVEFTLAKDDQLPILRWEYSTAAGWREPEEVTTGNSGYSLKTPGIAPVTVAGHDDVGAMVSRSSYWLRAKTNDAVPVQVSSIAVGTVIYDRLVPAYLAFFNNVPLDISKDFFPFGERPKFNDTLYIASLQALSIPRALITLDVVLSQALPQPVETVSLAWEYWDGSIWRIVGTTTQGGAPTAGDFEFSDTSQAFTQAGAVTFRCPPIVPTSVNGIDDYWIRIRIIAGDYGREAGYQQTANAALQQELAEIETDSKKYQSILALLTKNGLVDTFMYVAATFAVPSIKSMDLSYSVTSSGKAHALLTENSFTYRDVTAPGPFQPFFGWNENRPALYLVFDPVTTPTGTALSIYLQVVQPLYGSRQPAQAIGSAGAAIVVWWYWNGTDWQRLPAEDETTNLTRSGLLRFISPANARERYLFGRKGLWIRASLESGGYAAPPRLGSIALNTVWASHGVTFRDHILGSSNGDPDQRFQFAKTPILAGQIIEVREPTPPGDADQQRIAADEGPDAVRTVTDAAGNVIEVWVRWHAVSAMSLSTPADRHYVVDHVTGTITFGDSVHGRIPPAGKDSIMVRIYRAGGGAKGQCALRTLTELKTTIPLVDQVFNLEASHGGADAEAIANVAISGPLRIKSRNRAVTVEDYEWLAREAAGEVAKSRCLALTSADSLTKDNRQGTAPGWITVIIVPHGDEDQPLPTENLLHTVKDFLTDRALATLGSRIDVIGPRYVPIDVAAEVIPLRIEEAKAVEKRVFDELRAFLHPLSGGPDGEGWEFGRAIYLSEVGAVVQGTEGVDRVRNLSIRKSGSDRPQERIAMASNDLAASGHHTIVATGA
jgi:hypothetical protein